MTLDQSRRWGIDLIGILYLLASVFVLATFRDPSRIVMACVIPMALLMLVLGLGMIARIRLSHPIMIGLLWFTLIGSGIFCAIYLAQMAGWIDAIPALDPKRSLARTIVRMSITWYTLSYITRPDVKAEFTGIPPHPSQFGG